jgi:8-oxo-dGTP diphosphatase
MESRACLLETNRCGLLLAEKQRGSTFLAYQHTAPALIRRNEHFLLVKHRGLQALSWWLPGGVVKPGETLVAALQRELLEETGPCVDGTPHSAFVVQLFRQVESGLQGDGFVFHFSCEASGQLYPHDPDGLVLSAEWREEKEVLDLLRVHAWYACVPIRRWLSGEAGSGSVYTQQVGSDE